MAWPTGSAQKPVLARRRGKVKAYYAAEGAFYAASVFMLVLWEERRRDFAPMLLHHLATVALIAASYAHSCAPARQFWLAPARSVPAPHLEAVTQGGNGNFASPIPAAVGGAQAGLCAHAAAPPRDRGPHRRVLRALVRASPANSGSRRPALCQHHTSLVLSLAQECCLSWRLHIHGCVLAGHCSPL